MLTKTRLFSFVAFKCFQMECICPTAVSAPERHFSPGCCFGWPSSLGNTGHRNLVKLFHSFSVLVDKEFIYTENIQKCAPRLMWGIEQHHRRHRLWFLSVRRWLWAVSGIVSSMKKSPRGDLFTGSGSSNRRRWLFAQCVLSLQKSLLQNAVHDEGLHK